MLIWIYFCGKGQGIFISIWKYDDGICTSWRVCLVRLQLRESWMTNLHGRTSLQRGWVDFFLDFVLTHRGQLPQAQGPWVLVLWLPRLGLAQFLRNRSRSLLRHAGPSGLGGGGAMLHRGPPRPCCPPRSSLLSPVLSLPSSSPLFLSFPLWSLLPTLFSLLLRDSPSHGHDGSEDP